MDSLFEHEHPDISPEEVALIGGGRIGTAVDPGSLGVSGPEPSSTVEVQAASENEGMGLGEKAADVAMTPIGMLGIGLVAIFGVGMIYTALKKN